MTHDRARELLLDHAYGELAPDEARELTAHLASFAGCAAEREQLASVRALAARAAPLEPSGRGRVALLAAAREAGQRQAVAGRREERSPFAAFLRPALWTAAATTALIGIVIGATLKLAGPATERDRLAPEPWSKPAATSPAGAAPSPEAVPPAAQASQPGPSMPAAPAPSASEPPAQREAPAAAPRAAAAAKSAAPPAREDRREAVRAPAVADAAPPAPTGSAASEPLAAPAPAPSARREAVPAPAPAAPSAAPAPERLARAPASAPAPAPLAAGAQRPQAPADPVVDAIERRRAAGELSELRRRPGGCVEDRRGFVDAPRSKILLVVERRDGGLELLRWYDDDGRLRAVASGGWSAVLDVEGAVSREQGAVDPATRSIALEARDASDALFGAARGCPAAPAVP